MSQSPRAGRALEFVEASYGDAEFSPGIASNLLDLESALAEIYGFDPGEAGRSQPIEMFIERVHQENRPRLGKMIAGHHS